MELTEIWASICLELQQVVSVDAVTRWFRPLRVHNYSNKTLTLSSDNSIYQYWIEENYISQLKATSSRVLGENVSIIFQAQDGVAPGIAPDVPPKAEPTRPRKEVVRPASQPTADARSCLNPRSTFESFVVGENNRFAHAAALAVAQRRTGQDPSDAGHRPSHPGQ
jgi:chromosomal replication initiator protein